MPNVPDTHIRVLLKLKPSTRLKDGQYLMTFKGQPKIVLDSVVMFFITSIKDIDTMFNMDEVESFVIYKNPTPLKPFIHE